MKVILDTGAFLALADEDDDYHVAAKSIYADLLLSRPQFLTSNFVLSETYTVIRSKVSHPAAVQFIKTFDQTRIKVLRVSEAIEETTKGIFVRHDDKVAGLSRIQPEYVPMLYLLHAHQTLSI